MLSAIGILCIAHLCPDEYANVISEKPILSDLSNREMSVLGINHQQAGYFIAKYWGLPDLIASTCLNLYEPDSSSEYFLYEVSSTLSYFWSILSIDDSDQELPYSLIEYLDVPESTFIRLTGEVESQRDSIEAFVSLLSSPK